MEIKTIVVDIKNKEIKKIKSIIKINFFSRFYNSSDLIHFFKVNDERKLFLYIIMNKNQCFYLFINVFY